MRTIGSRHCKKGLLFRPPYLLCWLQFIITCMYKKLLAAEVVDMPSTFMISIMCSSFGRNRQGNLDKHNSDNVNLQLQRHTAEQMQTISACRSSVPVFRVSIPTLPSCTS
ncbi:unnamed protein product [Amoebophrya sp. A25]|nr:unnamed protein product [Amoebophrya sp. A25]|eukprot:GSA25T00004242001.1